jgi:glucuronoarabinoxylan endo-1,4-beta-xylanase
VTPVPPFVRWVSFASVLVIVVAGCSKKNSITGPEIADSVTVNLNSPRQVIRGFGAANIVGWRADMTAEEVQMAFGTGAGQLGFTILRLRIPPDSTQFDIDVPSAKLAYSMGARIIASPWTPPARMKSSDSTVGGMLDTNYYGAYAAHLKAFADHMSSNGVPLYAVSVQNEPDVYTVNYECCFWSAAQFVSFMKNNAPSVGVPVFMPESMNFNHSLSDASLNDPAAATNIAFIGGHLYGVTPSRYSFALSEGKEVWMTEYLDTNTTWSSAFATAKSMNDCMNADMSAYIWWYIVRFYGPIDDGERGGKAGAITKRGYVMSQFARFVRPGFYRVDVTPNSQANVSISAYKNEDKVVIVALNRGSTSVSQPFNIPNAAVVSFTPYVTSSSKNCVRGNDIPVSNSGFKATLDPSSVTTFVSD